MKQFIPDAFMYTLSGLLNRLTKIFRVSLFPFNVNFKLLLLSIIFLSGNYAQAEISEARVKFYKGEAGIGGYSKFVELDGAGNIYVVISSNETNPTKSNPIIIKVDFENEVLGFTLEDLTIAGGSATKITGSGKSYVVEVTPAAEGEITIDIAEGIAQNAWGAKNDEAEQFRISYLPNKGPVDIILDNTSFNPDLDVSSAIGHFSTVDEDDDQHLYKLVTGRGDNHLFSIVDNQLFLNSNAGLSGKAEFNIRVRSTDPWNVYVEKDFTLTKTTYHPATDLKIVDAFSPNGDGINDTWIVPELRYYDIVQVEVFDRAGNRLFFTKDPEEGWNGRNKSGKVVPGAYFYMIRIDDTKMQRGVITVHKR